MLQTLRDHGCKPRQLYPAKLLFTINAENKTFQNKNKFKKFVATNPALQKVIEGKSQPQKSNIAITAYNNQTSSDPSQPQLKEEKHTNSTTHKKIKKHNNRSQQPLIINIT